MTALVFPKLLCASVFVAVLFLQLQQPAQAFKIIQWNVQAPSASSSSATTTSSSTTAAPASSIQSIKSSLVGSKINLFSTLLNTVLQLKQNVLRSYSNSINSLQSLKPIVYTKTINIGYGAPATAATSTSAASY